MLSSAQLGVGQLSLGAYAIARRIRTSFRPSELLLEIQISLRSLV